MKTKYFYDKDGAYIGASNHRATMEGAAGSTDAAPDHSGQVFDSAAEAWGEADQGEKVTQGFAAYAGIKITEENAAYVKKVSGYTLRQCKFGLRRAMGYKRDVLQARVAELQE